MKTMVNKTSVKLKIKLDNVPRNPGIYLFRDKSNNIIYIGKAKVLRNRVRSYFQNSVPKYIKTHVMVKKIADLEYIITDTEKEALILEANMVKLYRPRYNIHLKDDKSFPYIKITNEDFPRVFSTRKKVNDGSAYFGPNTEAKIMRTMLWTMRKIFPVRSCQYNLTPDTIKNRKVKLCLDYHIKRCEGPCEDLVSKEDYNVMVEQIRDFLSGHTKNLIDILTQKMHEEADNQRFEAAAEIRDRLREIGNFKAKQKVVDINPVDRDILAIAVEDDIACGVLFLEREGRIIGRRHHSLESVGGKNKEEILQSFLMQVYLNTDYVPPEIFISHKITDKNSIVEWLAEIRGGTVRIITPQIGEKAKLTKMCLNNAELLLKELMLQQHQKKDYVAYSVQALQKDLNLNELPMKIEAFDISNIQGKDAVASMVSFNNGAAQKNGYRIFKIRSKDTPDDFAMIAEAVERRYSRLKADDNEMPDLILIDGGKGQISAAMDSLRKLDLVNIPLIGLAKRLDEVSLPGISEPQNISRTSSGLRLLQRVRDEAHRFALMHHRKQRKKRTITSELDSIPGIGPERKKALLKYFGSVTRLRVAAPESIAGVKSISGGLAQSIYKHLHNN
ncbi:excinuclease ABC subunit C [candidate division KSB1 bacterium]|nr:excinuclease ABC subunit C [candidate division KSB1 bacterium]